MRKPVIDKIARTIADKSDPARASWFTDETELAMSALLEACHKKRVEPDKRL